jgi:hypothetical protein
LSGFLGKARIIGFRGGLTPDGTLSWDLCVQPGKERKERGGSGQREFEGPTSSSRMGVQHTGRLSRRRRSRIPIDRSSTTTSASWEGEA